MTSFSHTILLMRLVYFPYLTDRKKVIIYLSNFKIMNKKKRQRLTCISKFKEQMNGWMDSLPKTMYISRIKH